MLNYYNYIPLYAGGGAFATLAGSTLKYIQKWATKPGNTKEIYKVASSLRKTNKDAAIKLVKFAKLALNGPSKELETASKELQTILKPIYLNRANYKDRVKRILEWLNFKKIHSQPPKEVPTETVTEDKKPLLDRVWNIIKKHPYIATGVGVAIGTGPGRYVTKNTLGWTQSNPDNWFTDLPEENKGATININGIDLPIKLISEGKFTLADDSNIADMSAPEANTTTNTLTVPNVLTAPPVNPNIGGKNINDIFEDDSMWLQ